MYNFGYKFRAGVALDGVYDHSANMKESYEEENGFYTPPAKKQMALAYLPAENLSCLTSR